MSGYEVTGEQGVLDGTSNGALPGVGQAGFGQENIQYGSFDNAAGQVSVEQQQQQHAGYGYQQAVYSSGSTVEGQQYSGRQSQSVGRMAFDAMDSF